MEETSGLQVFIALPAPAQTVPSQPGPDPDPGAELLAELRRALFAHRSKPGEVGFDVNQLGADGADLEYYSQEAFKKGGGTIGGRL